MSDSMKHGGPDDSGLYNLNQYGLYFGHRRLSLIDLSEQGHQPMIDAEGQVVIIFNGEVYNFIEIRNVLISKGYVFKSTSDTEVVLYAYKEWGSSCFDYFNGMFALALYDKRINSVIIARDHAGIKPLYYSLENNSLIFASEVRAFKRLNPDWPENPDWKKYFLVFGSIPEPHTTLKGVQSLPKGSYAIFNVDSFSWQVIAYNVFKDDYSIKDKKNAIELIHSSITSAVKRTLISDAPIGLFLSGGIDSSLLTLLSKPLLNDHLHTLSIVFESEKFSEQRYQDIIISKTGAQHKSFIVTKDEYLRAIPDILMAMDQPSNDGINSYFISKYAHAYGLTAVLSGLGADELFGGYQSFQRRGIVQNLGMLPKELLGFARFFKKDKLKKLTFLKRKDSLGSYLFSRGFFIPAETAKLLECTEEEIWQLLDGFIPDYVEKYLPLEQISFSETNFYMQNQLLRDTDYMSMWHSLEVRVPFLDKDVMKAVYSIHPSVRYSSSQIKHLLIKAFKDILPEEIWNRPKQGFVFPFESWMKDVQIDLPSSSSRLHLEKLKKQLLSGSLHWSRYWVYLLSQIK
jgi:asparagine synthase (glutamine-hydrolysing)